MTEPVNLNAHRAITKNDNRNLSLDDLVTLIKQDEDAKTANGYIVVPVRLDEDGSVSGVMSFWANLNKSQGYFAMGIVSNSTLNR